MKWDGGHGTEPADCRVYLDNVQMVRALYVAFRLFVDSDRYDALAYEELDARGCMELVLDDADLIGLANALALRGSVAAYGLLDVLLNRARDHEAGHPRRLPLADYVQQADVRRPQPEDSERSRAWFDPAWDGWGPDRRRQYVYEIVYPAAGTSAGMGERLRQLRSPLVEVWLERHADFVASWESGARGARKLR